MIEFPKDLNLNSDKPYPIIFRPFFINDDDKYIDIKINTFIESKTMRNNKLFRILVH